jgi:DinB family protein
VNSLFHAITDDLTPREWTMRAFPGSNPLGFTLWHLPRTQDWAVQTVVRGLPEMVADVQWNGRGCLQTPGIGAGFTREEADEIAGGVAGADVLAYADAVHQTISGWLSTLRDDDLDAIPDMVAHQALYPEYQRPSFREEVDDMAGMPVWRFLLGPCIGHSRGHLGELEILKQASRASGQET